MTKRERIEVLERKVAELERRLDAMLAAGVTRPGGVEWAQPRTVTHPCDSGTITRSDGSGFVSLGSGAWGVTT